MENIKEEIVLSPYERVKLWRKNNPQMRIEQDKRRYLFIKEKKRLMSILL
jgi:hypothetical protein